MLQTQLMNVLEQKAGQFLREFSELDVLIKFKSNTNLFINKEMHRMAGFPQYIH